jgi:malate dehydrogenase
MANIAIIGAGNVGANTAFFIAERNIGSVVMFDVQDGLAKGKALDMMEAAPIRGYQHTIAGTDSYDEVLQSQVAIVTAGAVRQPGAKRDELFSSNRTIIDEVASNMKGYTGTVVIATEPVDPMVTQFVRTSGLPSERVIGLGGVLDSTRLRYVLGRTLGVTTENVSAMVIGRHSDEMIALPEYSRVSGVPITMLMGATEVETAVEETRRAGDVIVEMSQRASSYYGPSAAAADVCQALLWDTRRILPVSIVLSGQYGIEGVALSLPAVLGASGVERIIEPKLDRKDIETLKRSAESIRAMVA